MATEYDFLHQAVPVLQIKDLTVSYRLGKDWQQVIRDINLTIPVGLKYGVVGESGSGKTTLALSILGYLSQNARIEAGSIILDGADLCLLGPDALRETWGKKMSFVPQDPSSSLNPSLRIEKQMTELLQHQLNLNSDAARERAFDLLESVHIVDAERVLRSYPHQISGGMKQRILIAMAISTEPRLLILDEPTTGLDVTTQAAVLDLIREVVRNRRTAVLYVTHNLGVVGNLCDRVAVLYAGELLEDAPVAPLFSTPYHPYTAGLLESVPRLGETGADVHFSAMPGQIPPLGARPRGCVFEPRCPLAVDICKTHPDLFGSGENRLTRCHRWDEIAREEVDGRPKPAVKRDMPAQTHGVSVLDVRDLSVRFPIQQILHRHHANL